ncbi:NUDIX hydrolase [Amedibacillus sp. YH-ame6]
MVQKKSTPVYDGVIFKVTKDEVDIKGTTYQRDIVHHNGGVGILAIQNDKLLFVKQYRYAVQEETIEIPAGKLEQGEVPYESALRELEEESGYTTNTLHTLAQVYSTPGFCNEKLYLYWCNELIKVEHPLPMDEDEDIEIIWMDVEEAYQKVESGEITDAKTIIAIQYAKLHFTTL